MQTSTVPQLPNWQVLHPLRERESIPMLVAFSDHADGTGTTFHFLSLSLSTGLWKGNHNFESNSNFLASILTLYLWHKIIFFPPLTLCWKVSLPRTLVCNTLLALSRGVLKTGKLNENTMFIPSELWVSGIAPHLYGSFNQFYISYLSIYLIHPYTLFIHIS